MFELDLSNINTKNDTSKIDALCNKISNYNEKNEILSLEIEKINQECI